MATKPQIHDGVEATITLLNREVPLLEKERRRLEAELNSASERLDAARTALESLRSLADAAFVQQAPAAKKSAVVADADKQPAPKAARTRTGASKAATAPKPAAAPKAEVVKAARATEKAAKKPRAQKPAPVKAKAPARATRKTAAAAAPAPVASASRVPGVSEAIVAHLTAAAGPVKVREVAGALGRADTAAGMNTVRTSLERLVKSSRVQRVGRGTYQVAG
ncbi:hypothetical protein ACFZB9_07940 [Kitasatospora sp. NPDC008050]|uniref:hypothetical protein n=1 Tax=Kitasatospora sp. NPDC008050 TaxID=3364021 RepID=UPI0036ED3D7F